MRLTDVECPECGDYMKVLDDGSDQTAQCPECKRWYSMSYDAEFILDGYEGHWRGTWKAVQEDPPDWHEVQGCLRYHEDKGC